MEPLLSSSSRGTSVELEDLKDIEETELDQTQPRSKQSRLLGYLSEKRLLSKEVFSNFCLALLPTFITALFVSQAPDQLILRRTSPLDGLRGVGALCVVNYHIISGFQNFVNYGYGLTSAEAHREPNACAHHGEAIEHNLRLHQLPIIRLVYSGSAPVCIFFVISGFVLSYRPLQLTRSRNWERVFTTLSSSTFRRFFRLFLPTTIATFITMLLIQAGAWDYPSLISQDKSTLTAEIEYHQVRLPSFGAQFVHWLAMLREMTSIWEWDETYPKYDVHLWTIPMEYRSSLLLFLVLMTVTRLRFRFRVSCLILLILYCYSFSRWATVLFLAGSLIAETSILYDSQHSSGDTSQNQDISQPAQRVAHRSCSSLPATIFRYTALFMSLYLLSAPDYCVRRTPGYVLLGKLIPCFDARCWRFYPSLGSILLVAVVAHSPKSSPLSRIFDTRPVQYLGWLSYSLYIVHGPLVHGLGYRLFPALWSVTGRESNFGYVTGFFISWALLMLTIFWVADRFCEWVDERCVNFSRWVERQVGVRKDE